MKWFSKKKIMAGFTTCALFFSISTAALAASSDAPRTGRQFVLGKVTAISEEALTLAPVDQALLNDIRDAEKGKEKNKAAALEAANEAQDQTDFSFHKGMERNRGDRSEEPKDADNSRPSPACREDLTFSDESLQLVLDDDTQIVIDGEKGSVEDLQADDIVKVLIDEENHAQIVFSK